MLAEIRAGRAGETVHRVRHCRNERWIRYTRCRADAVPAGVAVVRISGPLAGDGAGRSCAARCRSRACGACARLRRRRDGAVLDQGLVLWFPGPRSETGEDMAELQLHGGRAVVAAVFRELAELGLRLAEPGEFARRAFVNGKLDLTEVEGLADLIAAETEVAAAPGAWRRRAVIWLRRARGLAGAADRSAGGGRGAAGFFGRRRCCRRTCRPASRATCWR